MGVLCNAEVKLLSLHTAREKVAITATMAPG